MQPTEKSNTPSEQSQLKQRPEEKTVQPINQITRPQVPVNAPISETAYDPTSDPLYQVPSLEYKKPAEISGPRAVSLQHKSLLILAIVGFASTAFTIWQALAIDHAIQRVLAVSPSADVGTAHTVLNILWGEIVFNIAVYTYFLVAKNPLTVAVALRVLLFLQVLVLLDVFLGGAANRGVGLFVEAAWFVYMFIVLSIVKTPAAL